VNLQEYVPRSVFMPLHNRTATICNRCVTRL